MFIAIDNIAGLIKKDGWRAEEPDLSIRLTTNYVCLHIQWLATFPKRNVALQCLGKAIGIYSLIDRRSPGMTTSMLTNAHEATLDAAQQIYNLSPFPTLTWIMTISEICTVGVEPRPFLVCTGEKPKARPR